MSGTNGAMVVDLVASGTVRANPQSRFTAEQEDLIRATCCGGASKADADVLISIAEARGLNPILGECYFVERWDNAAGKKRWAVQASIDSFRIKAEQTGLYAGQDEPEYEYDDNGQVALARVKVYRKDWPRPMVGVARWSEYVQTTKDGQPTKFWRSMPHNQLAKCAEALALRKAFPAVLAKIYTPEEMMQADNHEPAPKPRQEADLVPLLQASVEQNDRRAYQDLCDRVDAAETVAALGQVASAATKAARSKRLTKEQYDSIKQAYAKKKALLQPTPPPSKPAEDDGPAHEANEAEAEAMAAQFDE